MNKLIFVPIGSYEQHGPHLPPDTDYLIAKKIVENISAIFNGKEIEGIKIGISPEHEGFKNTKSISQKEFQLQIDLIIRRFQEDTKFVFINTHGGNTNTLNSIQKKYLKKILVLNTFSLIKKDLEEVRTSKLGGICHAGEFETSLMLYLYPEKVNLNKLDKNDVNYIPSLDPNYEKEKLKEWKAINLSKSGILGDPYHATPIKGQIWFNNLIQKIKSEIRDFIIIVFGNCDIH